MAISGGDGSIILTTSVDTSGISKGSNTIKTMLNNIGNSAKQTGVKIQSAFVSLKDQRATFQVLTQAIKDQQYAINALSQEYAELVAKGKGNSQQAQELRGRIEELTAEMKELEYAANSVGNRGTTAFNKLGKSLKLLASYLIGIQTVFKFIDFSREAGELATQQEASAKRLIDIYGEASKAVGDYIDLNARGIGMSKMAAISFASTYGNIFSTFADQRTNAELTNEFLNLTAVIASKTGRTVENVQEKIQSGLFGNLRAIDDLGIFVRQNALEMTEAFKRIADGRPWEQLNTYEQQQVRAYAILEQGVLKYGDAVMQTSALTRAQYRAAYEDMQATWGQFVNAVLLPVLRVVTQIMNIITAGLRAIAGITGKTIETSQIQASSANDTANAIGGAVDNQKDLTKATKATAKEQKKMLANFDEIQILSANSTGGAGGGTGGAGAVGGGVADLGLAGGGGTGGQEEGISTMLATIMGVVGGAMVALGVLLIWNGHIGWGIGFIIAGASAMGVSAAAIGNADIDFSQQFSSIMAMVGGSLLALGLVLFFKTKSHIAHKIGLGMIIAGAGVLAVSAVQIVANQIGGDIGDMLHGIVAIASGFLLAIGLIMLFSGKITPLSIGLTITGAVGLASEVALYPDAVIESLRGWLGAILALLSTALLVIGIIMCSTGHITPVSIGLIIAGAVGLASVAAINWDFIVQQMQGTFGKIMAIVSAGLLVIGLILLFVPGAQGLALGLIIAGAAGLATVVAFNWNFIVDKVKEVWGKVKEFWNTHIAPIFTAEWWKNLGKKVMNGLIAGFEAGINGIIGMFEKMINWIVNGLNKISFDIPDWVPGIGGKTFGFNLQQVKFNRVSIPRLAQGAVIPPNREFLAVLGDQKQGVNIETPLQTMVDAFNIALAQNGGAGSGKTEVVLEIDGREFGRAVVEQGNRENRRIGTRLVIA